MMRSSVVIFLLLSQLIPATFAVEDTAKRVIASHTRTDMIVLPSVEQLNQLSDADLQRLIEALGGADAAARFSLNNDVSPEEQSRLRNQGREFIRAQLIRIDPRRGNNPFNTNDPVNNAFSNGQVVATAADELGDPGVGDPGAGDPGGGDPGVEIPEDPPLASGQIFAIGIGSGRGLKLDIIGGQLVDIGGFAASATISVIRSGEFAGTVNRDGLLPAGGDTQFFIPVFNLSQTGQPTDTRVSTLDGRFFALGATMVEFSFRQDGQNFIITTRQAFIFNRLFNGGFSEPATSTSSIHMEIRPGDNGVIPAINNCPVQTLAVGPIGFGFEANVAFDIATSSCRYNVDDRAEVFEFNQNLNFTTGNCAEMKLRKRGGGQLLLDGVPFQNPAILALGSSHTLRFTDISTNNSARGSARDIEFDFTVENTLAECIAAGGLNGNSDAAEQTGRITITAVRELP